MSPTLKHMCIFKFVKQHNVTGICKNLEKVAGGKKEKTFSLFFSLIIQVEGKPPLFGFLSLSLCVISSYQTIRSLWWVGQSKQLNDQFPTAYSQQCTDADFDLLPCIFQTSDMTYWRHWEAANRWLYKSKSFDGWPVKSTQINLNLILMKNSSLLQPASIGLLMNCHCDTEMNCGTS